MKEDEIVPGQLFPRTIIGLYDSNFEINAGKTVIHTSLEIILNYLGLTVEYHDASKALPQLEGRDDIAGILSFFSTAVPKPYQYLIWATKQLEQGRKFIIFDNPGFISDTEPIADSVVNRFWKRLGIYQATSEYEMNVERDDRFNNAFTARVIRYNPDLLFFERNLDGILPSFPKMLILDDKVKCHLTVGYEGDEDSHSCVITTGPKGSYVASKFCFYSLKLDAGNQFQSWLFNPFKFFEMAIGLKDNPRPDPTTLSGRRIYYSHIDGDGWNNLSEIKTVKEKMYCSEMILNEVIIPHPQFPITVGPIAADINPTWQANKNSRAIAEKIFTYPQVEVGCHTYTHPFDWLFFYNYTPEKEEPFLPYFPNGGWKKKTFVQDFLSYFKNTSSYQINEGGVHEDKDEENEDLGAGYEIPRAYANQKFDMKMEVIGAIDEINTITPPGKPVQIYQWSGNGLPPASAIAYTVEAGVKNINGGEGRFDHTYNSYSWVKPIGREIDQQKQIYASNSNENTYTELWHNYFYAFATLPHTFYNTETPVRLKPMNLYYHMYSGQKLSSLNAIKKNLEYASGQEIAPIHTSDYAGMALGFYSVKMTPISSSAWKISDRGDLQTIRFDHALFKKVDLAQSKGVIGQKHFQGSLYVALDAHEPEPIIALAKNENYSEEPYEDQIYLIDSRWKIWHWESASHDVRFVAQGFGQAEMRFKVPRDGKYELKVGDHTQISDAHGEVNFSIETEMQGPYACSLRMVHGS